MTFSTKIDIKLADKLIKDLKEQGFLIDKIKYTIFRAKKQHLVCTLYDSGKLVVQGKEKDSFIEFYLEPCILKEIVYTHKDKMIDDTPRIGVDESGKGDFFGPLVVVGAYLTSKDIKEAISYGVKDSKKISDGTILKLYEKLKKFTHETISLFPVKYNDLYDKIKNLNLLLGWAHSTIIFNLVNKTKCNKVIIDQFAKKELMENAIEKKKISIELIQKYKAEEDVVVAVASIIARAKFLLGLKDLSREINIQLPKGGSNKTILEIGRQIIQKFDENTLDKVSKSHFKTKQFIVSDINKY